MTGVQFLSVTFPLSEVHPPPRLIGNCLPGAHQIPLPMHNWCNRALPPLVALGTFHMVRLGLGLFCEGEGLIKRFC